MSESSLRNRRRHRVSLLHVKGFAVGAAFGEAEEIVIDTALIESEEVSLVEAN